MPRHPASDVERLAHDLTPIFLSPRFLGANWVPGRRTLEPPKAAQVLIESLIEFLRAGAAGDAEKATVVERTFEQ